LGQAIKR